MKQISICILAIIGLFLLTCSNVNEIKKTNLSADGRWEKVDSLEKKGLYRSAWEVVNEIFSDAQKKKDYQVQYKALCYQLKFSRFIDEESKILAIERLEEVCITSDFPLSSLSHSLLAQSYWSYFTANQYKILNRTTVEENAQDDIRFWDLRTITQKVHAHYSASLQSSSNLKKIGLSDLADELLIDVTHLEIKPTLFDLLAYRALDFYTDSRSQLTSPVNAFKVEIDRFIVPATAFSSLTIETEDTLSFDLQAILLFQELLSEQAEGSAAWMHTDLKRLLYVYDKKSSNKAQSSMNGALLFDALDIAIAAHPKATGVAAYHYHRARLLSEDAPSYEQGKEPTKQNRYLEALKICEETISSFEGSHGANLCLILVESIKNRSLQIRTEEVILPNTPSLIRVDYRNFNTLYFRMIPISPDYPNKRQQNQEEHIDFLRKQEHTAHWQVDLPSTEDHQIHSIESAIPELASGRYAILASSTPEFKPGDGAQAFTYLYATSIAPITRRDLEAGVVLRLLDRASGEKQVGAKIMRTYTERNRARQEIKDGPFVTDSNGEVRIPHLQRGYNQILDINYKNDHYRIQTYSQGKTTQTTSRRTTHFFLDRSIYRPGQTVHFKAIMLQVDPLGSEVAKNQSMVVDLMDVNYQKVSSLTLTTNDFGSCHGSFTVPSSGLTGAMTLVSRDGRASFSVEEYKRPKFEVTMDPIQGEYQLGGSVQATGSAMGYNGAPISDGLVCFSVNRQSVRQWYWYNWWRPAPANDDAIIEVGTTTTDEFGNFEIDFTAHEGTQNQWAADYFIFSITADVTDLNGETRSGSSSVNIGKKSILLDCTVPTEMEKGKVETVEITATNLNGEPINANGEWEIHAFQSEKLSALNRKWDIPQFTHLTETEFQQNFSDFVFNREASETAAETKVLRSGSWTSAQESNIFTKELNALQPGRYVLKIKSTGADGADYASEKVFSIYEPKKSENVFNEPLKLFFTKNSFRPGEKAEILVSTSLTNLRVKLEVEHQGKVIWNKDLVLNNSQELLEIPIDRQHQDGLFIHATSIKSNRNHSTQLSIPIEAIDRILDVKLETYRDKMLPGSTEEWRLKVAARNGEKVISELLLGMYDASLDQFKMHEWNFSPWHSSYARLATSAVGMGQLHCQLYAPEWNQNKHSYPSFVLPSLNTYGYLNHSYGYSGNGMFLERSMRNAGNVQMDMAVATESMEADAMSFDDADGNTLKAKAAGAVPPTEETPSKSEGGEGVHIRKNFNETAFFFPEMKTDLQGNLIFSFTMPEALTKWKFQALAHSQKLQTGQSSQEVLTQKELMVVPNPPRFFREGDQIELSCKVVSLLDEKSNGKIRLELLDALSMKTIDSAVLSTAASQDFSLKANSSAAFNWTLNIPDTYQAITYRFIAESAKHSDGEEAILAVLSNRMLVHESMPFSIAKENSKRFSFERMNEASGSKTLKQHSLTMEFTGNPVWFAVQAMPYMMEYPYDCSEQIFTRYYANALAGSIINKRPKLSDVFERWKTLSPETFLSNLEKNQELKYVLLEETPWVLEAQDENERKKRLGLLLDLGHMTDRQARALHKLKQNQLSSGAWPWFNGMRESLHTTQHIISGLGHLKTLGALANQENLRPMIESAIGYLDAEHLKRFKEMKRHNPKYQDSDHTGAFQIQYLYARSFFPEIQLADKSAHDFYADQAAKYWLSDNDYLQAMTALALHRLENKSTATDIMKSLKERSIISEELGMYWKNYTTGWYWHQPGIEKHALMVEAFDEIMDDKESVYALKQWLIFNKQTNDWKTTKATAEACYALLLGGSDWTENRKFSITVGQETFSSDDSSLGIEAGTGYLKKAWSAADIRPEMAQVLVKKEGEAPAWGALHWQYFEDMDKITLSESPIKIRKQVSKVNKTQSGETLTLVSNGGQLEVGDKIRIRMEIETDRQMEYVHIKDMRSAGFEPVDVISGMIYSGGLGFYKNTRDASTNFFIDNLRKGSYVLEYDVFASQAGDFSNGITSIQCMYAPEFTSHSEGIRVQVGQK